VEYNPYDWLEVEAPILAMVADGETIIEATPGDVVAVLLPATGFYIESGGQVSDTGIIRSLNAADEWVIRVTDLRKPAAGVIVHLGEVVKGNPKVGDPALAQVDVERRRDIMRNHTATHLLHAALHAELGKHARQAGSLVAPDRLRFDFNHPQAVTAAQLEHIEASVNRDILGGFHLNIVHKPLEQAMSEGAMALFGEKYGETVRTISIGGGEPFSYELCGGTHVDETGDIGVFIITSEGSAAAGIRRIEAVTGRTAYELIQRRFHAIKQTSGLLAATPEDLPAKTQELLDQLDRARKQVNSLRLDLAAAEFNQHLQDVPLINGIPVLTVHLPEADADTLRQMSDRFRQRYPSGVVILSTAGEDERPLLVASVSEDLVKRGLHAGELVKAAAQYLGGSGGGRPTLAQAGGKDAKKLLEALASVPDWVRARLK
jgi:alanyl-tRNA synthetase